LHPRAQLLLLVLLAIGQATLGCSEPLLLGENLGDGATGDAAIDPACAEPEITVTRIATGSNPDLVWTGDDLGLVWQDGELGRASVFYMPLRPDGTPNAGPTRVSERTGARPRLAFDGSGHGITYLNDTSVVGADRTVFLTRVDRAGTRLGPDTRVTSTATGAGVRVAFGGGTYAVTWTEDALNLAHIAGFDATGIEVFAPQLATNRGDCFCEVDLAWSGSNFGLAWDNDAASMTYVGIWLQQLDSVGATVTPESVLTEDRGAHRDVSLTWASDRYALAWSAAPAGAGRRVGFMTVAPDGVSATPEMNLGDPAEDIRTPDIVSTESGYGVAWTAGLRDDWSLHFAVTDRDGSQLSDSLQIATATVGPEVSLVWTGAEYVMAFWRIEGAANDVYLARVGC